MSLLAGVLPEEPESLPTSGEMTSPNFPSDYPNNLHERKTIEVAKGNVINIHFTYYELESPDQVDYIEITDGDGTLLGHFGAAHYVSDGFRKGIKIPDLTSVTETVHVLFHTDDSVTRSGWRLEWSKLRLYYRSFVKSYQTYFKVLLLRRESTQSSQQAASSPLRITPITIPTTSAILSISEFLRATPSGCASLNPLT